MHWRVLRDGLAGGQVKYLDTDPSVCAGTVTVLMKQVGGLDVLYQMRDRRHSTVASYRKSSKQMLQKKKSCSGHELSSVAFHSHQAFFRLTEK